MKEYVFSMCKAVGSISIIVKEKWLSTCKIACNTVETGDTKWFLLSKFVGVLGKRQEIHNQWQMLTMLLVFKNTYPF